MHVTEQYQHDTVNVISSLEMQSAKLPVYISERNSYGRPQNPSSLPANADKSCRI